jgi:hypothetical protein
LIRYSRRDLVFIYKTVILNRSSDTKHYSRKAFILYRGSRLIYIYIHNTYIHKGKAVPLQAWSGPKRSRNLRFPYFITTAQDGGNVVSLTHRPPLPPGNTPGTHFCYRLSQPQCCSTTGRIKKLKNSNDTIGNRTHDLAVYIYIYIYVCIYIYMCVYVYIYIYIYIYQQPVL